MRLVFSTTLQNQSNEFPPQFVWRAILNEHHNISSGIVWNVQDVRCVPFGTTSVFHWTVNELSWVWWTLHNFNLKFQNVQSTVVIEIIWFRCTHIEAQLILNVLYGILLFSKWLAPQMEVIDFLINPNAIEGKLWTSDWNSINFNEMQLRCHCTSTIFNAGYLAVSLFSMESTKRHRFSIRAQVFVMEITVASICHYRVLVWITEY